MVALDSSVFILHVLFSAEIGGAQRKAAGFDAIVSKWNTIFKSLHIKLVFCLRLSKNIYVKRKCPGP